MRKATFLLQCVLVATRPSKMARQEPRPPGKKARTTLMYIPPAFRVDDSQWTSEFLQRHSFATLVTSQDGVPSASHLPVLFRPGERGGTLLAHMARANPQWQHFANTEVLTVFAGPHAYISPTLYESQPAVPTWNYAAVHVYGVPRIIRDQAESAALLQSMVQHYEASQPAPWNGELPPELQNSLIRAIVAFEISITCIEAKLKVGQNRSKSDRQRTADRLDEGGEAERALAELTRMTCRSGDRVRAGGDA